MSDDLAGGEGRPLPRWVRSVGTLGLVALVVVGGWQAQHATPSTPPPAEHQDAGPVDPPVDFHALRANHDRTGVRMLVGGHTVSLLDLDTGATHQVAGIPADLAGYQLQRTEGDAVLAQTQPQCPDCRPPAYVVDSRTLRVTAVGGYDGLVPAARADQMWGYRLARDGDPDETGSRANSRGTPGFVRLLDLVGRPLGPPYPMPEGTWPQRGTVAGLLVVQCCGPNFSLWDPPSGRLLRSMGAVLAATPTRIAWANPSCVLDCAVEITDLTRRGVHRPGVDTSVAVHADGLSRIEVPIPSVDRFVSGAAFSPDGRTLAVYVPRRADKDSTGPAQELYLITPDGIARVHGSAMAAAATPIVLWTGSRLVLAVSRMAGGQPITSLATATLADPDLVRAGNTVPGFYAVIR